MFLTSLKNDNSTENPGLFYRSVFMPTVLMKYVFQKSDQRRHNATDRKRRPGQAGEQVVARRVRLRSQGECYGNHGFTGIAAKRIETLI